MPFTRTNRKTFNRAEDPDFAARFGIAQDQSPVGDMQERQSAQLDVREFIFSAALEIRNLPGESTEKTRALEHLQLALMLAGKHIFTVDLPEPEGDVAPVDRPGVVSDARDYPWAEQNNQD